MRIHVGAFIWEDWRFWARGLKRNDSSGSEWRENHTDELDDLGDEEAD